ncbi:hypothetical protein CRG98_041242 [Punica granatum]|uniref:Uncharacterized protein n=1 Tax=Punica granatum TaxID=22663 RepID=A0A2I0I353_PUNGR|nr:hypothetical protein CRG98_041242 [Punica granatum]
MNKNNDESSMEEGRDDYTEDGTVDLKGKPIRRSRTGRWRACSFIVGTVTSSSNVTDWVGTTWLTPILGAYIADAYLRRYWTFMIGSAIYLSVFYQNLAFLCTETEDVRSC